MAQIVCISYIPWRSAPSRSQELLSHIPEAEVLFFQPASSRRADAAAGRAGQRMASWSQSRID